MFYKYRIPPLFLLVIVTILMYMIKPYTPSFVIPTTLQLSFIFCLFILGIVFIISGGALFRKHKTTVNPITPEASSTLVTSGIYSISRNPMYVGFLFILIAWGIYLLNIGSLLLISIFFFYINTLQIPVEENALRVRFGEAFNDYELRVRRWL